MGNANSSDTNDNTIYEKEILDHGNKLTPLAKESILVDNNEKYNVNDVKINDDINILKMTIDSWSMKGIDPLEIDNILLSFLKKATV